MRAFLAIIALSMAIGVAGVWTLVDAASQYTSTLRAFTSLEIRYQPGSFVWTDPEFERGRATIVFTNNSPANARVNNVSLYLLFDGEFAGSGISGAETFTLARGESRSVVVEFIVISRGIQARGGSATLGLSGDVVASFSGIDRDVSLQVRHTIGQVATVEEL
jgi:hypothetical protein